MSTLLPFGPSLECGMLTTGIAAICSAGLLYNYFLFAPAMIIIIFITVKTAETTQANLEFWTLSSATTKIFGNTKKSKRKQ